LTGGRDENHAKTAISVTTLLPAKVLARCTEDDVHGHVRSLVVPDEGLVEDEVVRVAQSDVDVDQHCIVQLRSSARTANRRTSSVY